MPLSSLRRRRHGDRQEQHNDAAEDIFIVPRRGHCAQYAGAAYPRRVILRLPLPRAARHEEGCQDTRDFDFSLIISIALLITARWPAIYTPQGRRGRREALASPQQAAATRADATLQ